MMLTFKFNILRQRSYCEMPVGKHSIVCSEHSQTIGIFHGTRYPYNSSVSFTVDVILITLEFEMQFKMANGRCEQIY